MRSGGLAEGKHRSEVTRSPKKTRTIVRLAQFKQQYRRFPAVGMRGVRSSGFDNLVLSIRVIIKKLNQLSDLCNLTIYAVRCHCQRIK